MQPNTTIAAPWPTNNYTMAPKKRKAIATTALVASGKGKGNNVGIKKTTKLHPTTEFEYDDDDDDSNEICWLANACWALPFPPFWTKSQEALFCL